MKLEPSALRSYENAPELERVWARLERGAPQRAVGRPLRSALLAAGLVGFGAVLGIAFERANAREASRLVAAPESFEALAPLGGEPRVEGPGRAGVRPLDVGRRPSGAPRSVERRRKSASEATAPAGVGEEELLGAPPLSADARAPWLALADRGEYSAAFDELERSGGFDAALAEGSAEELMTLADVARFAGRDARAISALRVVVTKYPVDENAPIAAMTLGNLLSRAGDEAGAAEAYALTRALSPSGDFAQDALAREFDMAVGAKAIERVRDLLRKYEREFPAGRHLEDMRGAYDELARELISAPPPDPEPASTRDRVDGPRDNPYEAGDGSGAVAAP